MSGASVRDGETAVLLRELDRTYPLIDHAEGIWLVAADGTRYLDAVGGGAMVASLGHAIPELVELAPPGFSHARFVSGGSEANELALRLARSYHVERGEPGRVRFVTQAQAYHGPTWATLSLTGRPGLHGHYAPYVVPQLHVPPSTWRLDPTGQAALDALDRALAESGPGTVAAFFCEAVSAASLPAYSPPDRFWEGLAERRERHGFLVCVDEVVTGLGRTGAWFASERLPLVPDVITTAKGLGAGYAPIGAVLCREHVHRSIAEGSRELEHGHTWDGAPLSCAVGSAVVRYLREHRLVEHVAERGPRLRDELEVALAGCSLVAEVRGRGFLLGVDYCDPRDGRTFLPRELRVARRIDDAARERGLVAYSTQPTADGWAGDQTLLAPAFVSTEAELAQIVSRLAASVRAVESEVLRELARADGASAAP